MAEVLLVSDDPVEGPDGREFEARICGRSRQGGLWEGWIEFVPSDGSDPVRTGRETTQPNRKDLEYWAGGLSIAYLEGALSRAVSPGPDRITPKQVTVDPHFQGPAEHRRPDAETGRSPQPPAAVLDPFEVYGEGEDVLRKQLDALDEPRLRDIARKHRLLDVEADRLHAKSKAELADAIVRAVEVRMG